MANEAGNPAACRIILAIFVQAVGDWANRGVINLISRACAVGSPLHCTQSLVLFVPKGAKCEIPISRQDSCRWRWQ